MADQEIVYLKANDHKSVYANHVLIRAGIVDFLMEFGVNLNRGTPEEPLVIEQNVSVYLSPQEAKLLAEYLQGRVQEYERAFGAIPNSSLTPAVVAEPSALPSGGGPLLQ